MCGLRDGQKGGVAEARLHANVTAHGAARLALVLVSTVVVESVVANGGRVVCAVDRHVARIGEFRGQLHCGMGRRRAEHQRCDHDQKNAHCGYHDCTVSDWYYVRKKVFRMAAHPALPRVNMGRAAVGCADPVTALHPF